MLRSIFHKLGSCACLNRNKVFLGYLLFETILTDDTEESALNLLQRVIVNEHVIVMEVELLLICSNFCFVCCRCSSYRILFYNSNKIVNTVVKDKDLLFDVKLPPVPTRSIFFVLLFVSVSAVFAVN